MVSLYDMTETGCVEYTQELGKRVNISRRTLIKPNHNVYNNFL